MMEKNSGLYTCPSHPILFFHHFCGQQLYSVFYARVSWSPPKTPPRMTTIPPRLFDLSDVIKSLIRDSGEKKRWPQVIRVLCGCFLLHVVFVFFGGWPLVLLRADVDIGFISFSKANSLTYCNYTVDGQNIETLDNFIPRAPPNFKVVFFFQGLRHVDKRNQTPQHDMSRTHCLTLTCGDGGVSPIFSSRFEYFLSIYGITLTIELEFFSPNQHVKMGIL